MTDYDVAWAELVPILESGKERAPKGTERLMLRPSLNVKVATNRFLHHLEWKGNEEVKEFMGRFGNLPVSVKEELNARLAGRGLELKRCRGQWSKFNGNGNNSFGWQNGWSEWANVLRRGAKLDRFRICERCGGIFYDASSGGQMSNCSKKCKDTLASRRYRGRHRKSETF